MEPGATAHGAIRESLAAKQGRPRIARRATAPLHAGYRAHSPDGAGRDSARRNPGAASPQSTAIPTGLAARTEQSAMRDELAPRLTCRISLRSIRGAGARNDEPHGSFTP
jgi:hypothetical protein